MTRPIRRSLPIVLAVAGLLLAGPGARAQTFTRITDPANPVVNDALESGGGSWEDVNGDGLLDLFVACGNLTSQNDRLYVNLGGMAFRSVVTGPVVTKGGTSIGGCWGDWDADGLPDLWVTNRSSFGNFLFHGLGDSLFVNVVTGDPITDRGNSNSASWVDADGDGDLDLYVVNFTEDDLFYRNDGPPAWTLARASISGPGSGADFSIHGAWADFDNDGDADLFLGKAGLQDDDLWINQGSLTFIRRIILDGRATLGASWGDFDNDGDLDLFAANFNNQASILYRNDGSPAWSLTPVTTAVFPTHAVSAVGSAWGDVDNDGDLDLLVAADNTNEALFLNSGPPGYTFTQVTTGPLVSSGGSSFGCSFADIDRDGDLDAFVANRTDQPDFLFRNDGPAGHWLTLRLRGVGLNPSAIGARVRLRATIGGAPRWQMQEVAAMSGYNSQNPELHFGLGDATFADSLEVRWPDGALQSAVLVAGDRWLEIVQGEPVVGVAAIAARVPAAPEIRSVAPNPAHGPIRVTLALPAAGGARLELIDLAGRQVAARTLPALGAGEHVVTLALASRPAPGVYFVRLSQGGRWDGARVALR
jgi:hypothetical protein